MYGRNSYLGKGFCTHGVDEKSCKVCPVEKGIRDDRDKFEKIIVKYAVEIIRLTGERRSLMLYEIEGIHSAAWKLLTEAGITKKAGTAWTLPKRRSE